MCGVCSRREADVIIDAERVTINGKIATLGDRVSPLDKVCLDNKEIYIEEEFILLAYNKPLGVECTADAKNPDNIIKKIGFNKKIFYVGRLDKNSTGLILMTNDGMLCNKIAKSVNGHEKEYIVETDKEITNEFLMKMKSGVNILDVKTKPCKVRKLGAKKFGIILTQGLNRQIRRMCDALGYKVVSLKRIRVMNIELKDLAEGTYRMCTKEEIEEIRKQAGI